MPMPPSPRSFRIRYAPSRPSSPAASAGVRKSNLAVLPACRVPVSASGDEPGEFPQYGEHCFATYWLDPHGFKLEAVCHTPEQS